MAGVDTLVQLEAIDTGLDLEEVTMSDKRKPLNFVQVFTSVIASFFGVQSTENRERDFTRGRAKDFILVGLLLTGVFVLVIWGVVQLVTRFSVS